MPNSRSTRTEIVLRAGREPTGIGVSRRKDLTELLPTKRIADEEPDDDDWQLTCECDAGMIAAAPSKTQVEDTLTKLSPGVKLELWWQPMKVWYEGQVTDIKKSKQFVRIRCVLENGKQDNMWYHSSHIKFRNIRSPRDEARASDIFPETIGVNPSEIDSHFGKVVKTKGSESFCSSKWPSILCPFSRSRAKSKTVNGKLWLLLRKKQTRAKTMLHNVYGLRVEVTIGDRTTERSLERIRSCITSHTGIMSITSIPTVGGEIVCVATQTQAAIVGIENIRKPPKSLITFLKENVCIWIIDTGWNSCLREFIPEDRMVEWNKLKPATRNRASVTELLSEWHWPTLRVPEERGGCWKSLSPSEEEISWISFITWAKVTAAWTIGLEEPCLMISKDVDPSRIWAKVAKETCSGYLMEA